MRSGKYAAGGDGQLIVEKWSAPILPDVVAKRVKVVREALRLPNVGGTSTGIQSPSCTQITRSTAAISSRFKRPTRSRKRSLLMVLS